MPQQAVARGWRERLRRPEALAAAVAVVLATALTRRGALLDPDSPTYLATARMARSEPWVLIDPPSGTTLSIRGLFAPVYPAVLAAVGRFGDELVAARWIGVVLAGIAAWLLVGLLVRRTTPAIALTTAALLALSRGYVLVLFGFVMSDGLALVLLLGALHVLVRVVEAEDVLRHRRLAALGGALAGLALATRFASLGIVLGVTAAVALYGAVPRRARLAGAGITLALGLAPMAAWTLGVAASGETDARRPGRRALDGQGWELTDHLQSLVLPRQASELLGTGGARVLGVLAMATLLAWTVQRLRRGLGEQATALDRSCASVLVVAWTYLLGVIAARTMFDRQVGLGGRFTLPWLTCIAVALALDVHRRLAAARTDRPRKLAVAAVACVGLLASVGLVRAVADPTEAWFNIPPDSSWPLIATVETSAPDLVVYTNHEERYFIQTGRTSRLLPPPIDRFTGAPDPNVDERLEAMATEVRAGRAVVVVFTDDPISTLPIDELADRLGLEPQHEGPEGAIFAVRPI